MRPPDGRCGVNNWSFPAHWMYVRLHRGIKYSRECNWQHNPRTFDQTIPSQRGIHVGASRLLIIDEDQYGALVAWLQSIGQALPETLVVQTASGKFQYYYNLPDYVPTDSVSSRIGVDGFRLDLLAGMRLVPAPGAEIVDIKRPRRWEGFRSYNIHTNLPIATAPDWIVNRVPIGASGIRGTNEQVQQLYGRLDDPDGKPCAWMQAVVDDWVAKIKAAGAHCHQEGLQAAWAITRDGAKGHRGAFTAMAEVREEWLKHRRPTTGDAELDWDGRDGAIAPSAWAKAANAQFDSFFEACTCSREVNDYAVPEEVMTQHNLAQQAPQPGIVQPMEPVRIANEHYVAPLEYLPDRMYQFVQNVRYSSQTVPEMALLSALCSVSFVTGGNLLIDVNGYFEPVTLWAVLTALPSQRKSGALTAAVKGPLKQAINNFWRQHAQEQRKLWDQFNVATKRITKLQKDLATDLVGSDVDSAYKELDIRNEELDDIKARMMKKPVLDVTDTTVEGIEMAMEASGGPIASFADEAALLTTIAGRYTNSKTTLSTLNQAWGRSTIHTVRAGQTRHVENPHLVLCQLVQPKPFGAVMSSLGEVEDGFLSRWLYADPPPHGPRRPRGQQPNRQVIDNWTQLLTDLLHRFWGIKEPETIHLDNDAWEIYDYIFPFIDQDSRSYDQVNTSYSQWLGKAMNAHILRVAALFQLIEDPKAQFIRRDAMNRAVGLFYWLRAEALKAMRALKEDQLRSDVEHDVLSWIAARRDKNRRAGKSVMEYVEARSLARGPRRFRNMRSVEIEAILTRLADQRWLEETESKTGSATWKIRPDFEDKWYQQA